MTIELTERALYLIIKAISIQMDITKSPSLLLELDDLIQDLQFQSN